MSLDELVPGGRPEERPEGFSAGGGWAGTILDAPASAADLVRVLCPGISADQPVGPAPFEPRGAALPSVGDNALVVLDDDGAPWIVAWRPA